MYFRRYSHRRLGQISSGVSIISFPALTLDKEFGYSKYGCWDKATPKSRNNHSDETL